MNSPSPSPSPAPSDEPRPRPRVPAAVRREALIEAAVHEFAHGGLNGTSVERIARRVGVAQPYVFACSTTSGSFSSPPSSGASSTSATSSSAPRRGFDPATARRRPRPRRDGRRLRAAARLDRDYLMLQHQAYAACDDEVIRDRVRGSYARLVAHVERLSGAEPDASMSSSATGCGSTSPRRWVSRISPRAARGSARN